MSYVKQLHERHLRKLIADSDERVLVRKIKKLQTRIDHTEFEIKNEQRKMNNETVIPLMFAGLAKKNPEAVPTVTSIETKTKPVKPPKKTRKRKRKTQRKAKPKRLVELEMCLGDLKKEKQRLGEVLQRGEAKEKLESYKIFSMPYLIRYEQIVEKYRQLKTEAKTKPEKRSLRFKEIEEQRKLSKEYLAEFEPSKLPVEHVREHKCPECGEDQEVENNKYICRKCGLVGGSAMTHGDFKHVSYDRIKNTTVKPKYMYRRINHLSNFINRRTGNSRVNIPGFFLDKLRAYFKTVRVDLNKLTPEQVYKALKCRCNEVKTNKSDNDIYRNYYDYIFTICAKLNPNYTVITVEHDHMEELKNMLDDIELIFYDERYGIAKLIHPDRKNFFSYPYLTFKMCQLRQWTQYYPIFQIQRLQTDDLIARQDRGWEKVCKIKGWPFYPTIGAAEQLKDFTRRRKPVVIETEPEPEVVSENESSESEPSELSEPEEAGDVEEESDPDNYEF